MRKKCICIILSVGSIIQPNFVNCQTNVTHDNYLDNLPKQLKLVEKSPHKYLMTAEYFSKNIYGDLLNKTKITGEYTRGLDSGYVSWNNVFITHTINLSELYQERVKQDYMENIKYIPSLHMIKESFFESFPESQDNIYSRNLIWDMMAIEGYAWNHLDSLNLNQTYIIPEIHGAFEMANIGTYNHAKVELTWIGISKMNNKLCAIIEYRALDNKLELNIKGLKSKGNELYWGKTWVSLENKQIEFAEMFSYTAQEMEIQGLPNKIIVCTKRVLNVNKIQ